MKKQKINHVAVIILTVLNQMFSAIWYGAFANHWMSLNNLQETDIADQTIFPYLIAIIAALITNYVFAYLFKILNIDNINKGIKLAAMIWIAFTFTQLFTVDLFSLRPLALPFVNGGISLINFVVSGVVLAAWKKYDKE